ncbi:MAG: lysine decarboxylase, partial [Cyanobacteriota bacterium]|nr:lysine decarboxylase [Cyanobacteriota bacterium]
IAQIPELSVLQTPPHPQPGFFARDRTRLVVFPTQLGLTGFEVDELLHQHLGVTAELPMLRHITFMITSGNTSTDIDRLIRAFQILAQSPRPPVPLSPCPPVTPSPSLSLSPREAFFAATETLPLDRAIGRISAELVCPYPPGIPVLMPGEAIAPSAPNNLRQILALGGSVTGCSDPSLETLKVILPKVIGNR